MSAASKRDSWLVVCVKCQRLLTNGATRKEAFHEAYRHQMHGDSDVLLVDSSVKVGRIDTVTRGGYTAHHRVAGEAPGGPVVARILLPKSVVARPFAVICTRCQELLAEAGTEEEAFAAAQGHAEHYDREVLVICRLVDVGDRHVVTRSGQLVSVRGEGEPDGGRWQGLLEAAQERKTA